MPQNFLEYLQAAGRLTPGPFVKASGSKPWRPILMVTDRDVMAGNEVLKDWDGDFAPQDPAKYQTAEVGCRLRPLDIDRREILNIFNHYGHLCRQYYRDAMRPPSDDEGLVEGT